MLRGAVVAGIEFVLPLIQQLERGGGVADLISQVVGDAAVGVDVKEVLAQAAGQEPAGDGKILVVGAGEACTVCAGFVECGRSGGDGVVRGQAAPAESGGRGRRGLGGGLSHRFWRDTAIVLSVDEANVPKPSCAPSGLAD